MKIKNMTYDELMIFRSDFMRTQKTLTRDVIGEDASAKFWQRMIQKIESDYQFTRPISDSEAAVRKRRERNADSV
jgi:hypothetical protein